jgi:hypothetical protein
VGASTRLAPQVPPRRTFGPSCDASIEPRRVSDDRQAVVRATEAVNLAEQHRLHAAQMDAKLIRAEILIRERSTASQARRDLRDIIGDGATGLSGNKRQVAVACILMARTFLLTGSETQADEWLRRAAQRIGDVEHFNVRALLETVKAERRKIPSDFVVRTDTEKQLKAHVDELQQWFAQRAVALHKTKKAAAAAVGVSRPKFDKLLADGRHQRIRVAKGAKSRYGR